MSRQGILGGALELLVLKNQAGCLLDLDPQEARGLESGHNPSDRPRSAGRVRSPELEPRCLQSPHDPKKLYFASILLELLGRFQKFVCS